MTLVRCNVALSTGCWQVEPTFSAVCRFLKGYFGSALQAVVIMEPGRDAMLELEVTAFTGLGFGHSEAVRDHIAEVLLRWFWPEYESMIEVEVLEV